MRLSTLALGAALLTGCPGVETRENVTCGTELTKDGHVRVVGNPTDCKQIASGFGVQLTEAMLTGKVVDEVEIVEPKGQE
ncbi:hypothetical protein KA119_02055 [Candidatus Gracilibacteria bacterium]|nr:hypothetical protein [Candidatus Gracilibacteria bacterium]